MSIKDILKKSVYDQYITQQADISVTVLMITLLICALLCLFMVWIYKFTYKGALYSSSFAVSMMLTGTVTSLVILPISHNLTLSLGMVGALSIVRFRTAVKDPKDIAYMFWAIAIGLTCGAGFFLIAIAGTAFIAILMVASFLVQSYGSFSEPCVAVIRVTKRSDIDKIKKLLVKMDVKSIVVAKEYVELTAEIPRTPDDQSLGYLRANPDIISMTFVKYNGDYAI